MQLRYVESSPAWCVGDEEKEQAESSLTLFGDEYPKTIWGTSLLIYHVRDKEGYIQLYLASNRF